MGYEITKFNFQDDLASASFNAKFKEVETYLNNIEEGLKTVKEKNTEIEKENQKLREQLDNKVEKNIHLNNNTDFNTLTEIGAYSISVGGINAPVSYNDALPTHWSITVRWGNPNSNVFYQIAQTVREPNKIFKRQCINGGFGSWITFTGTP